MKACHHLSETGCHVVAELSGIDWQPDPRACESCIANDKPKTVNVVTIGVSIAARRANSRPVDDLIRYLKASDLKERLASGTGTELKKIFTWFSPPKEGCDCPTHEAIMNVWGPDKCLQKIEKIANWVLKEAEKQNYPTGPVTRIAVKEMIKLAVRRSRRK